MNATATCSAHRDFLKCGKNSLPPINEEVTLTSCTDEQGRARVDVEYQDGSILIFVLSDETAGSAIISWRPNSASA